MVIYLDFDGTVVEHEYPQIGRCNFGCMEVIKKLQDANHTIILNTYRADCNDGTLEAALKYLNEDSWTVCKDEAEIGRITEYTKNKICPPAWNWDKIKETGIMFIDDIASGIPLKPCCMINNSNMVDWDELDKQFKENKIY